jgi:hypothetical protein
MIRPHHRVEPVIPLTTTATPATAIDVVHRALTQARVTTVRRDGESVRMRAGSFWRWHVADVIDIDVLPRFAVWGFRADIDIDVVAQAPTLVRVHLKKVVDNREAVEHILDAVERAAEALKAGGHDAVVGEIAEGWRTTLDAEPGQR